MNEEVTRICEELHNEQLYLIGFCYDVIKKDEICKCKNNIKKDLSEIGFEFGIWFELSRVSVKRWAFVIMCCGHL